MSSMYARPLGCLAVLAAIFPLGCGGDDSTQGSGGASGGVPSTGGSVGASGGGNAVGGASGLGGAGLGLGGAVTSLGGGVGVGGATTALALGGAAAAGGSSQVATAAGGSPSSGGTTSAVTAKGGATSVGGTTAKGGTTSTGGTTSASTAKGGATSVGGTTAKGGTTSTGGTSSKGGSTSTGGATAKGGATSTGGATSNGTAPIKVWLAGDSTVANGSTPCPRGWGYSFDALFNANVTVVNSAAGGRSIQTWLYEGNVSSTMGTNGECTLTATDYNARWTAMTHTSTGMKAGDYLFIQFGINDGDSTCPRHVGTALYKTYLTTMANAAKAVGAIPIYLTPVGAISCSGSTAVASRGFITETKAAGTANGVTVIDLHQLSINLYNKLGLCPNSADYTSTTSKVGTFFCADHTHFEAAGATQIAGVVAQALKDQGVGLAAYLN